MGASMGRGWSCTRRATPWSSRGLSPRSSARQRDPGEDGAAIEEGALQLPVTAGGIGAELPALDRPLTRASGSSSPRATAASRALRQQAGAPGPSWSAARIDGVGADLRPVPGHREGEQDVAELGVGVRLLAVPAPPRPLQVVEVDHAPGTAARR